MEDNKILKLVYTFFVGLLLAMFVGVGISTFYPGPERPQYPPETVPYGKHLPQENGPTDEQLAKQREYEQKDRDFQAQERAYNRNVSIMTLAGALILLVVSILYERRIKLIADGIMLGGLFTLVYSIGRGFASENNKFVFVLIAVGLAVVLYLGYRRFVRGQDDKPKSKSSKSSKK